jgi:glucosamine-6-phosphate deaminase
VLLLPAGETPVPLYAELARRRRAGRLDLARAHLFQLDELVGVAPADERSFHHFFERHLAKPLGLGERLHLLDGSVRDPAAEIARHAGLLRELGGADLVLLGLGRNGHVAFNEPGSRPEDPARAVELCPTTVQGLRAQFAGRSVPAQGITLGLAEIAAARSIAMLVTGRAKAGILAALVSGERSSECPAALLSGHGDFSVLADEAACAELG